jgi:hypothetical protein
MLNHPSYIETGKNPVVFLLTRYSSMAWKLHKKTNYILATQLVSSANTRHKETKSDHTSLGNQQVRKINASNVRDPDEDSRSFPNSSQIARCRP